MDAGPSAGPRALPSSAKGLRAYQMQPLPLGTRRGPVDGVLKELANHCERMGDPWRPPCRGSGRMRR